MNVSSEACFLTSFYATKRLGPFDLIEGNHENCLTEYGGECQKGGSCDSFCGENGFCCSKNEPDLNGDCPKGCKIMLDKTIISTHSAPSLSVFSEKKRIIPRKNLSASGRSLSQNKVLCSSIYANSSAAVDAIPSKIDQNQFVCLRRNATKKFADYSLLDKYRTTPWKGVQFFF